LNRAFFVVVVFAFCCASNAAAPALDRARATRLALEKASVSAGAIENPFRRIEAHADRAMAHAAAGDGAGAREALRSAHASLEDVRVQALRDWSMHGIALAHVRMVDFAAASTALLAIVDPSVRDSGYEALAARQARLADYEGALASARLVRDARSRAAVLRDIATVRADKGDLDGALSTARSIPDPGIGALALSDVAAALAKDRDVAGARALAGRIRDAALRARALAAVAATQMEAGDVAGAETTADLIADVRERDSAFVRMARAQAAFDEGSARTRLASLAPRLERVRARPEWKAVAMRDVGEAWLAAGDAGRARQALTKAADVASGVRGAGLRNALLGPIARAQARAGDADGALATAARLQVPATHALVVRDIASAAAQAGEDGDSLRAAQALPDAQGRVAAMLAVLGVQLRADRTEAARRTLEAARQVLSSAERSAFGAGAMAALAVALDRIGDRSAEARLEEAFAAAENLPEGAERAAAYLAIAAALAE
jgi:hypothetical protein